MKNKAALFFALIAFTVFFFSLPKIVLAQSQMDWVDYCNKISSLPSPKYAPKDFPSPSFVEPTWDKLDKAEFGKEYFTGTESFKTTVNDTFNLNDTANSDTGAYGGNLTISNLSLPHAKEIADYLEGRFLDEDHRMADFRTFDASQNLLYNGPTVKLLPQKTIDSLRSEYVFLLVVLGKRPNGDPLAGTYLTPDINLLYTDVCGQNPRTLYDLVGTWDWPAKTVPTLKAATNPPTQADWDLWNNTWGRYWAKIPIHAPSGTIGCDFSDPNCQKLLPEGNLSAIPNMRSQGCLVFKLPAQPVDPSSDCPTQSQVPSLQVVKTGIPEVARLDALARFARELIGPNNILQLYFCKFRALDRFCGSGEQPARLGDIGPNTGEGGVGGSPIYLYNDAGQKVDNVTINLTGSDTPGTSVNKTISVDSKFPYLGITFGKLTAAITGVFGYFDPRGVLKDPSKYQKNSSKIPANVTFADTTDPTGGNVSEVKIWAGWLTGVKNSKDFVIDTLWPFGKK